MINISLDKNRSKLSKTGQFSAKIKTARERWAKGVYFSSDQLRMPLELALDDRLSAQEKLLGAIFFSMSRCTLTYDALGAILSHNGVSYEHVKKMVRTLKIMGYIRSYKRAGVGAMVVYEWIGCQSQFVVDNERWTIERSTEVAKKFL